MRVLAFLLAFLCVQAGAQTPAQQIQATSPQLVVFAGSDANLQSLASGLSLGQTVTLVTPGADGLLQIVTFTPPSALGSGVASALEQARTNLIARGIAQPTAQQIAVSLMGGTIATSAGQVTAITGVLTGSTNTNAVAVRNEFAANFANGLTPFGGSATNFQALSTGLRQGTPITLTGVVNGVTQTVVFTPPGGAMSAADANQLLQLANQSLLSLGIINPTPQQIQIALLGGTVPVAGGSVLLQGVLTNRAVNTSTSSVIGTSNSPIVSSPTVGSPAISSGAGATSTPIVGTTPTVADGVRRSNTAEGGANRAPVTGR
jgi:hypothetical protein